MTDQATQNAPSQDTPVSQQVPEPNKGVTEREWLAARKAQRAQARAQAPAEQPVEQAQTEEAPQQGQAEPEAAATQERAEDTHEDVDLRSEEAPEATEEAEEVTTQSEDDGEDTDEGEEFPDTLAGLAETLGYAPEDLAGHLKAKVKLDGTETEVPLDELVKGYQRQDDYSRKTTALAEERRAHEAAVAKATERQNESIAQLETVVLHLAQDLNMGPSEAELAALAESDPQQYVVQKAKRDALLQKLNAAGQEHTRVTQERQQEAQQRDAEFRGKQFELLYSKRPELKDQTKAVEFQAKLTDYMSTVGYTQEEAAEYFNGTFDARAIDILEDAMKYRAQQTAEKKTVKKLKKLPKPTKPGARASKAQTKNDAVKSARKQLRMTGTNQAGVEFLKARRLARRAESNGRGQQKNYV